MKAVGILAGAALLAASSPTLAAVDYRDVEPARHHAAAFAGASVRLPLGTERARPTARLQLTMSHAFAGRPSAAPAPTFRAAGLEFGASPSMKPTLYANGVDVGQVKRRLGFNGSTASTILIVGAVVLAGVVAYAVIADCDACDSQPLD
jgi:hypothetical protein